MNKIKLIVVLLLSKALLAQIGGQSVFQFLDLTLSPRQAALGGKNITINDYDVNQGLFNPAVINQDMHNLVSLNYSNLFGEVSYGTAAYAYTTKSKKHTFHTGIQYINYGTFDGRDEFGQPTGDFSGAETAVSFGYAYHIPETRWYLGANAKFITSALEIYTSNGGALDFGVMYDNEENNTNFTVVVRNFGTQFRTYAGLNEPLPFEILFGVSQRLEHVPVRWHLTLDQLQQWNVGFSNPNRAQNTLDGNSIPEEVGFLNNFMRHVILGVELFPEKGFNIRLGYNFRRANELNILDQRSFSGLTAGFGLKINRLRFNYAYSRFTAAANNSFFGLMIDLN